MAERKKTILYIEDDPNNRNLVNRILRAYGYEVVEAEDGMTGIRMAQEVLPDLILMDINMPGLDGYEAATRIKSLPGLGNTPVVAVTANVMKGDRERALTAGCDGYLSKPIDVDALPDQIEEFIGGRRERVDEASEREYLREYSERLVERLEGKLAELTKANEQLKRSDEMKSRFIAIAAHELRTPITVIRGYVDMLNAMAGSGKTDPAILAAIEGIASGATRLYEIVQDMLDVTQIEAGTLKLSIAPVPIGTLVRQSIDAYQADVQQRGVSITTEALDGLPSIWGDSARLLKVIKNLVSNAIKYTPDGGRVTISGRALGAEAHALLPDHRLRGESFVELVIVDSGVGVAVGECEHIFERFYEVRDPRLHSTSKTAFMGGGMGLGLAIARGVAEAHGGWIWAESEGHDPERCPGSRFHVLLPAGELPDR